MGHFTFSELKTLYSNMTDEQRHILSRCAYEQSKLGGALDELKVLELQGKWELKLHDHPENILAEKMEQYKQYKRNGGKKTWNKRNPHPKWTEPEALDSKGRKVGKRKKYATEEARKAARARTKAAYFQRLKGDKRRFLPPADEVSSTSS